LANDGISPAPGEQGNAIRLDPADNVAVCLDALAAGQKACFHGGWITVLEAIPAGHKLALEPIAQDAEVRKFGSEIGRASRPIRAGEWVHTHNLVSSMPTTGVSRHWSGPAAAGHGTPQENLRFQGYLRADGRVGTRNEVWILPTVGCVNQVAQRIAAQAAALHEGRADGFHAFAHPYGCSQVGEDLDSLRSLLVGLTRHPNAGGVLVIGLGCENNQLDRICREAGAHSRLRFFNAQEVEDEVGSGLRAIEELLDQMSTDVRTPVPLADLVVGVKCGGSDGFSSLTANPLVGRVSDRVTAAGGRVILSEVPEMFGAEHVLLDRAASESVFTACISLFAGFKDYFSSQGVAVDANPSPGNLEGGITTLQEKSLGAVQKGGRQAPVTQVLRYGERVSRPGLALLESPGNDAVSSTALVASGATVLLFTTGRGTPLGFPAPTIKISSNSDLARRKPQWIDFDAGGCLEEGRAFEDEADRLVRLTLSVASGSRTCNEVSGNREIAFWKRGVTL
jgi:altronate hydrolase